MALLPGNARFTAPAVIYSTVTLVCPLPPNAANLRRHWAVALRDKKAYWDRLHVFQAARKLPAQPTHPIDPATIALHFYLWSVADPDNLMARAKILVDWLKPVWIKDDSPAHLTWEGIPEQSIDRKNPRVEVTLSALNGGVRRPAS